MSVKPGIWVHHIVISWMSNGRKRFAGLLVCPDIQGASCFLVWRAMRNFLSQQDHRFAKLFHAMSASSNPTNCFLATSASFFAVEILGRNGVYLANKDQCGRLSKGLIVPPWRGAISDEAPSVGQIRELVRAREGMAPIEILEPADIALVLEFITTYWMKYI